jgi:hypothetical protein
MGTKHLVCVVKDNQYKVAQYGQWDGYPSVQGIDILNFLCTMDRPLFERKISEVAWITDNEYKEQWAKCGARGNLVSTEVAEKHTILYPENSRDTGAKILSLIQNSVNPIKLVNSIGFANNSLYCEWGYVIDLDKNTFEVYEGFNQKPLSQDARFYQEKSDDNGYYPIKLVKSFSIENLPNKDRFLLSFKSDEEICD